jgi:hypothetical protein
LRGRGFGGDYGAVIGYRLSELVGWVENPAMMLGLSTQPTNCEPVIGAYVSVQSRTSIT